MRCLIGLVLSLFFTIHAYACKSDAECQKSNTGDCCCEVPGFLWKKWECKSQSYCKGKGFSCKSDTSLKKEALLQTPWK